MHRIPDHRVFSKVFDTLSECCTLPSAHVSSEQARQQHVEEQEKILEMVQCNPTTSSRRLSTRLDVSQTRVWRTLHEDGLFHFAHTMWKSTPRELPCILNFVIGYIPMSRCFTITCMPNIAWRWLVPISPAACEKSTPRGTVNFVTGYIIITNCFHQYYSLTKLLSPVMDSTTHITHIDGLMTIHMVLWKHIFSIVSLSMCGAVWSMTWCLVPLF